MSKSNDILLHHIQEYFQGKDAFLFAEPATVELEETLPDETVESGNSIRLQFKDSNKRVDTQSLLLYLKDNGLDVDYALGNKADLYIINKEYAVK